MQDVERVERQLGEWRDVELARRTGLGVLAADRLWEERDEIKRTFTRAALGGDAIGDLTPEAIAAAIADIERREQARKLRQMPS